jgi:hypothetical protein
MNLTEVKAFGLDGFQPKTDGLVASLWVFAALLENFRGAEPSPARTDFMRAIGWPDGPNLPVQLSSR